MNKVQNFTEGPILSPLIRFALPVLLALFLQAMYGAVDLLVVGQFGEAADVSAVSTGSQILHSITVVITGLAMGITILTGQRIGEKRPEEAGRTIGAGICLFALVAGVVTALMVALAGSKHLPRPWLMCGSARQEPYSSWPTMCWAAFSVALEIRKCP